MRPIEPLDLPDVVPNVIGSAKPKPILVAPSQLRVDETYQRDIGPKGLKLIRRMVSGWDWSAFKPPIVVATDEPDVYAVVDGQHTSIAAATHPGIDKLIVLLIAPQDEAGNAMAFVRHNRDRVMVTKIQEWRGLVAAGDEDAIEVARACERNGVRIVTPRKEHEVGDTYALVVIADMLKRRHPAGLGRVLRCCVELNQAPIRAEYLRAIERLLYDHEYKGDIGETAIIDLVKRKGPELEQEARRFAAERRMPVWKALASMIFIASRKRNAA